MNTRAVATLRRRRLRAISGRRKSYPMFEFLVDLPATSGSSTGKAARRRHSTLQFPGRCFNFSVAIFGCSFRPGGGGLFPRCNDIRSKPRPVRTVLSSYRPGQKLSACALRDRGHDKDQSAEVAAGVNQRKALPSGRAQFITMMFVSCLGPKFRQGSHSQRPGAAKRIAEESCVQRHFHLPFPPAHFGGRTNEEHLACLGLVTPFIFASSGQITEIQVLAFLGQFATRVSPWRHCSIPFSNVPIPRTWVECARTPMARLNLSHCFRK
jgi:hypothetical protein